MGEEGIHNAVSLDTKLSLDEVLERMRKENQFGTSERGHLLYAIAKDPVLGQFVAVLYNRSETDLLTGLYQERRFVVDLDVALARAERHGDDTSLLVVDFDNLHHFNEQHGRLVAGDEALKALAGYLRASIRAADNIPYRLHGDEFVVIAEKTDLYGGKVLADRIREQVESSSPPLYGGFTVSIGVADSQKSCDKGELIKHAQFALELAKRTRNCVEVYEPASSPIAPSYSYNAEEAHAK